MLLLFFFKDTATTDIYTYLHTLSLHDALPICLDVSGPSESTCCAILTMSRVVTPRIWVSPRSNRADPWVRGMIATSADSDRMSVMPRPSIDRKSTRLNSSH